MIAFVVNCEQTEHELHGYRSYTQVPCNISVASVISQACNIRSANTILCIFTIVFVVANSTGRPERLGRI